MPFLQLAGVYLRNSRQVLRPLSFPASPRGIQTTHSTPRLPRLDPGLSIHPLHRAYNITQPFRVGRYAEHTSPVPFHSHSHLSAAPPRPYSTPVSSSKFQGHSPVPATHATQPCLLPPFLSPPLKARPRVPFRHSAPILPDHPPRRDTPRRSHHHNAQIRRL